MPPPPEDEDIAPAPELLTRTIPSSGDTVPALGIGTWQTFDVGDSARDRRPLEKVLRRFVERGGRVIDTSPMYGRSEEVVGELTADIPRARLFVATKVWTRGRRAGIEQMERSSSLFRGTRTPLDLMQVHNLLDVETHLPVLREWKRQGRIRYLGITHYTSSAYRDIEALLRREALDFLQINYSPVEPEADRRLLPLAVERGVAVIANRPFGGGGPLRRAIGKPLPSVARELSCTSWPQLFLKWILGHPAVTCAIPATSRVRHLDEILDAALEPLPDERQRTEIAVAVSML
ncbi:MAG: aldo/keto reductase [Acidobacteriota bacterium]